jgi:hypothetical protein
MGNDVHTINYHDVLADLETRKAELEAAIAVIKKIVGTLTPDYRHPLPLEIEPPPPLEAVAVDNPALSYLASIRRDGSPSAVDTYSTLDLDREKQEKIRNVMRRIQ